MKRIELTPSELQSTPNSQEPFAAVVTLLWEPEGTGCDVDGPAVVEKCGDGVEGRSASSFLASQPAKH
jgi:hypothetical protein